MQQKNEQNNDTSSREMVISRLINAPRELVFKVWTDPEHIAKWWGPDGFTNTIHQMDVRPGGVWSYMMHGPEGMEFPNVVKYREVVRPERLVYDHGSDIENDPDGFVTTVTFEEQDGKTLLTMRAVFTTAEIRDRVMKEAGAVEGGKQTLNKLEAHLAEKDNSTPADLVITRIFNAPRELVWKAWTEPEHFKRWAAPTGFSCSECNMDFRIGGRYHNCMVGPDGTEYWSTGTYKEIVAPGRLVFSDSFADADGNKISAAKYGMGDDWPLELEVIVTFEDYEGRTKFTLQHRGIPAGTFRTMTDTGWNESLDKLVETLV